MINRLNLTIFILLVMFESFLDPDVTKCACWSGKLLLLAHHFLSVYLLSGSILLGYPELHVVVNLIVIIVWLMYNKCVTTIYNNRLCNFDKDFKFKNFFYHIREFFGVNHFVAEGFLFKIFFLLVFDLYLIYKNDYKLEIFDIMNEDFGLQTAT